MIEILLSKSKTLSLRHLVLDYNGTLAIDGIPIDGVKEKLNELSKILSIHILTADTFGVVKKNMANVNGLITILQSEPEDLEKVSYIEQLNKETVIAIGNGNNDALMLRDAALGIAVIQSEGASFQAVSNADIVCRDIMDALNLVANPLRIKATLRK